MQKQDILKEIHDYKEQINVLEEKYLILLT
jgi:hypothetical protein